MQLPFKKKAPNITKEQMEQIQKRRAMAFQYAVALYNLVAPGAFIRYVIPLRGMIITKDKPQQFGILNVFKPMIEDTVAGTMAPPKDKPRDDKGGSSS